MKGIGAWHRTKCPEALEITMPRALSGVRWCAWDVQSEVSLSKVFEMKARICYRVCGLNCVKTEYLSVWTCSLSLAALELSTWVFICTARGGDR